MTIGTRRMTYSVDEAATILGVSRSKLYASLGQGELRGVQVGRRVVIPCDVLEALVGRNSPERKSRSKGDRGEALDGLPGLDLNSVRIARTISRAPEFHVSRNQIEVCVLDLAVRHRRRDDDEIPFGVDVVTFGTMAKHAATLGAGESVQVAGRLDHREWRTSDGSLRFAHRVVAWHVSRLERRMASERIDACVGVAPPQR